MPERRVRLTINSPVKICSAVANDLSAAAGGVGGHAHLTQRRARAGGGFHHVPPTHSNVSRSLSFPWSEEKAGE